MTLRRLSRAASCALAWALSALASLPAQTFSGTNAPGNALDFTISVSAPQTGLAVATTNNTGSAFSRLYLKSGGTASSATFDWSSTFDGSTQNEIYLERPELVTGNYGLDVATPGNSGSHSFTVVATANPANLRSATKPVSKPVTSSSTGALTAGNYHYFRVDLPFGLPGWRVVLTATGAGTPDLYISKDAIPTISTYQRGSTGQSVDTIFYEPNAIIPGAYYIGVYVPAGVVGTVNYTLNTESSPINQLAWDPGATHAGINVTPQPNLIGGDYYFKVTTQSTTVGAWRSALNVTSGSAQLYLKRTTAPGVGLDGSVSADFSSVLGASSNGFVLRPDQYSPGEDWYYLVRATSGAQWNLVSGAAYVQDLGPISASGGSGDVVMGAEGTRFFRTSSAPGIDAWALYLNGQSPDILVRTTQAPFPESANYHQLRRAGQLLAVPPYLDAGAGTYYIAFSGTRGSTYNLDSHIQPITDLNFTSTTPVSASGYRYQTYRVQVPVQQIAWEPRVSPSSGSASIAIRQDFVPNEDRNDAFSEVGGGVANSVTLSPAVLTNGTWYVTVYATGNYSASLTSGQPVITDINFSSISVNDAPTKVGWRFYRLADIAQQLGSLGWDLFLQNHVPGTEIALRRNAVPSRQRYRDGDLNPGVQDRNSAIDFTSTGGFLQRPGHQADIWYVGIYLPTQALGSFTLQTQPLTAQASGLDGSTTNVANQPTGKWNYRVVTVPSGILGWDLRVTNVTAGKPRLVVRRDQLPSGLFDSGWSQTPSASGSWGTGYSWAASTDWTGRSLSALGADETGRVLIMPFGRPLEPGTYYVGVINADNEPGNMTYSLVSRGIGTGQTIPVTNLAFSGGTISAASLPPREAGYYKVTVPAATANWRVRLTPTAGEALLLVNRGVIPSAIGGGGNSLALDRDGVRVSKPGTEYFYYLPEDPQATIPAGDYYIAVGSEGTGPVDVGSQNSRVGTGTSTATLDSLGTFAPVSIGSLGVSDIVVNDSLACGDAKTYQLTIPAGVANFEFRMENRVGEPSFRIGPGTAVLSTPTFTYNSAPPYGFEVGGYQLGAYASLAGSGYVSIPNPVPGTYSITVRAFAGISGQTITYPAASYTLRVVNRQPLALNFDGAGSSVSIANQDSGRWQYFQVTVPPGSLGWDLRLTNVTSGSPRLQVRRDLLPAAVGASDGPFSYFADFDWTRRPVDSAGVVVDGRTIVLPAGAPLTPGTYYIGVNDASPGAPMSYTLQSRGIGAGFTIPVTALAFSGGSAPVTGLTPREVAYYKVTVPASTPNWKVRLAPTVGEALLIVNKAVLPGTNVNFSDSNLTADTSPGVLVSTPGTEYFQLLPNPGETFLRAGDYYLGVVSEGLNPLGGFAPQTGTGTSNATLDSLGSPPPIAMGTIGVADLVTAGTLACGETKTYQFTVPGGVTSFELRMEDRTGFPSYRVGPGTALPALPNGAYFGASPYVFVAGLALGSSTDTLSSTGITSFSNPPPGTYSVTVRAGGDFAQNTPSASYTLRVVNRSPLPLAFDGGGSSIAIPNQTVDTWQYFQVTVPAGALGWDLRILNVTNGSPRLVVRRDTLPNGLDDSNGGAWNPPINSTWPSGYSYASSFDWSRRPFSSIGQFETGRLLTMPMGRPLEPGTYFVGVINGAGSPGPMSYTIQSRGIGSGYTIPVTALSFSGGGANVSGLAERQVAYYKVTIPAGTSNYKVRLDPTAGEAMLLVNRGVLPGSQSGQGNNSLSSDGQGVAVTKPGTEFYHLLPVSGQSTIPAGDYYLGVGSEGVNPSGQTMGPGTISATINSLGAPVPLNLGTVSGSDLVQADTLLCSEAKTYQFTVPAGVSALEVKLENRLGEPAFRVALGTGLQGNPVQPFQGFGGGFAITPGLDLGENSGPTSANVVTISNPAAGPYSLTTRAFNTDGGGSLPDASYTLRVHRVSPTMLNFSASQNGNGFSNADSRTLLEQQRAFYRVDVPFNSDGGPVIGWKLNVALSAGSARMRLTQNFANFDSVGQFPDIEFYSVVTGTGIVSLPRLNPGSTWYVEILPNNGASYTITSNPVLLLRPAWSMPAFGGVITTPGPLDPGDFGDSGLDTNGNLVSADRGTDLGADDFHFYAINVPAGAGGLLRARLDALSGNSDLFIRVNNVPTLIHADPTTGQPYVNYQLTSGVNTEYGNFVPYDGRLVSELPSGIWYLAVRAVGSNTRYRLHVSIGSITNITLNGPTLSNQTIAGGDWRYYRFQIPSDAPANVSFTFNQQLGSATAFLRDTLPPGEYYTVNSIVSWSEDAKNQGPYPTYSGPGTYFINTPPLRPGAVYYLGLKATTDCIFSISATSSGGPIVATPLAFSGGTINLNLAPGASALYRVTAPADAVRLKYTATKAFGVDLRIEQGTIPQTSGAVHHANITQNGSLNVGLSPLTWPYQPSATYYVLLQNLNAGTEPVSVVFNGATFYTEDEDADGVPDWWEKLYFGSDINTFGANSSPANDGLSNLLKYALGLDPRIPQNALLPRPVLEGGFLTLTITKPAGYPVNGITYSVESAGLLSTANPWSPATTTVLIDSATTLKVRDNVPVAPGVKRFIRLRVSHP